MRQAKTLDDKELKTVLSHCATRRHAKRDRALLLTGFFAGLRAKEIAALSVCDVLAPDGTKVTELHRIYAIGWPLLDLRLPISCLVALGRMGTVKASTRSCAMSC